MKPLRVLATLTATAAAVLAAAQPAQAAPVLGLSAVSFSTGHADVTQGPGEVELSFTVTDSEPAAAEISGLVELRQFAGSTQVGPLRTVPYEAQLTDASVTVRVGIFVPQYGATTEASWRVTKLTAHDGYGNLRTLRGAAIAGFGVTQLVEDDGPVLDQIGLGPGQSPYVVDPGTGVTVHYRVTVTDLQAGFWKGRLALAGPEGLRVNSAFAVASDGRHLTCGTESLISDIYHDVECSVPVVIAPGTPAGTWTVARVALTDQVGNSRVVARPTGPTVHITRGDLLCGRPSAIVVVPRYERAGIYRS